MTKSTIIGWVDGLPVFSIFGADNSPGGYATEGDLVTVTNDGIDLNALWGEFQATMQIYNERMSLLISLLTYPVVDLIETVPQVGEATFEMASEFGVPKSVALELSHFQLGYDFADYDVATRYTWKFLRDADARQVAAVHQEILRADGRLVFRKVMEALFDNRNRKTDIRNQPYNVYPLYNADGTVPPAHKSTTFQGTHSHYLKSGNVVIDASDLEDAYDHIAEHGYGVETGTTFVLLANKAQIREIRKWRQGEVTANGVVAEYDFIPSENEPALIVPNAEGLLGSRPPSVWNGLRVTGSYGNIGLIIEEDNIPSGYFLLFATGGAGNLQNLVGLREHANPDYRGLRLLAGNQQRYPLIDSHYARGFGTGVRQRAGAVIVQIGTGSTYEPPAKYTRGGGLV